MKFSYLQIKRTLDVAFAFLFLFITFPFLLIVFILTKLFLGKPVIFKQKRPGLNEKIFTIFKFRSLSNTVDSNGILLPDNKRLSKFGKFIRSSSLDELPQLFNIIKGDMSFVGPRPLRVEYLKYYSPKQKKRHLVRPGITGYAQVNGRNFISWEKKFEMDNFYVENLNFFLDLSILLKTVVVVIFAKNINNKVCESKPFNLKSFE